MAELAAFGIVVNVVQLIDFSCKVLSTGKQLYADGTENSIGTHEIKLVTEQFVALEARAISGELLGLLRRIKSIDEQQELVRLKKMEDLKLEVEGLESRSAICLKDLGIRPELPRKGVNDFIVGLRETLKGFNSRKTLTQYDSLQKEISTTKNKLRQMHLAKQTRWQSFRAAFLTFMHRDEILNLDTRLNRIRQQLNSSILVAIFNRMEQIEDRTASLLERNKATDQNISQWNRTAFDLFEKSKVWQDEVSNSIRQSNWQTRSFQSAMDDARKLTLRDNPDLWIREDDLSLPEISYLDSSGRTRRICRDSFEEQFRSALLRRLRFPEMDDRRHQIPEAYHKTCDWIFQDSEQLSRSWSNFVSWLCSQDCDIYWITGKPGSGKSTLAKYLAQDDRYHRFLQSWAQPDRLITAEFFSWNSGSKLQMSQLGFLRTLLAQILEQAPMLAARLFPNRRYFFWLFGDMPLNFNWSELVDAMNILGTDAEISEKFCFLVDGLDEFKGGHVELAQLLQDLSMHPRLKVCVASRPWPIFEDFFKHRPSLMLQNLTYHDMKHYVARNFESHEGYLEFADEEPKNAISLLEAITEKASGVFLWTVLVVRSLLAGLTNGDRGGDLHKRLNELPPDLEQLYQKILGDLEPLYLEQASRLLQITCAALEPPSLLCLSLAEQQSLGDSWVAKIENLTASQKTARAINMRRRLMSRCKGLLEVHQLDSEDEPLEMRKVHFLHRTVKDFFREQTVVQWLSKACREPFEPLVSLCRAYILLLPLTDRPQSRYLYFVFRYALQAEQQMKMPQYHLIHELDRVAELTMGDKYKKIVGDAMSFSSKDWVVFSLVERPTLVLAAGFNMHSFLRFAMTSELYSIQYEEYLCLLGIALLGLPIYDDIIGMESEITTVPNVESIAVLLEQGELFRRAQAVNTVWPIGGTQKITYYGLWEASECHKSSSELEVLFERWLQAIRLLIEYGAHRDRDWESELGSNSMILNKLEWRSKLYDLRAVKSNCEARPRSSLYVSTKKSSWLSRPKWHIWKRNKATYS
ncbi:MAG: hypothetical protein M1820_000763 [Bogoriella megaspora]|nr:MAG: hypothetical protein M1820_000763 [Bogoriella megaspora]